MPEARLHAARRTRGARGLFVALVLACPSCLPEDPLPDGWALAGALATEHHGPSIAAGRSGTARIVSALEVAHGRVSADERWTLPSLERGEWEQALAAMWERARLDPRQLVIEHGAPPLTLRFEPTDGTAGYVDVLVPCTDEATLSAFFHVSAAAAFALRSGTLRAPASGLRLWFVPQNEWQALLEERIAADCAALLSAVPRAGSDPEDALLERAAAAGDPLLGADMGLMLVARCALIDRSLVSAPGWSTAEVAGFERSLLEVPEVRLSAAPGRGEQAELSRGMVLVATAWALADMRPGDLKRYLDSLNIERRVRLEAAADEQDAARLREQFDVARHWIRARALRASR